MQQAILEPQQRLQLMLSAESRHDYRKELSRGLVPSDYRSTSIKETIPSLPYDQPEYEDPDEINRFFQVNSDRSDLTSQLRKTSFYSTNQVGSGTHNELQLLQNQEQISKLEKLRELIKSNKNRYLKIEKVPASSVVDDYVASRSHPQQDFGESLLYDRHSHRNKSDRLQSFDPPISVENLKGKKQKKAAQSMTEAGQIIQGKYYYYKPVQNN